MLNKKLIKILKSHKTILLVIFIGLLASKGLIGKGYFNMHDDLQMMRQLEMEKCFLDGQIPCRWVPDMGYGYGYPLFNYYPPLPYITGQLFRLIGYSFVDTAKILFIIAFVASGLTMYQLGKEFFGKWGGVVASIFYVWAPYHSVDIYVRGAMNESWALIFFPLIFWASYKLISQKSNSLKYIIALALSWFGLLTSHNLMVIIFTPIFALWCLAWLLKYKNLNSMLNLLVSGLFAFGLAAFFTLPVFLEKSVVQTNTLVVGYYEYTAHFPSISQLLFSRFWGYGPSVWMTQDDRMSFQIGWIHWISSLVVGLFIAKKVFKDGKKSLTPETIALGLLFATGWLAAFMAHPRSTPIWSLVNELKFVQFPWRYLTLVIFSFSFVAGGFVKLFPKSIAKPLTAIVCLLVIIYSWNYFLPEHGKLGPLTDEQKFTNAAWELQQTAGIYDYLPNTAKTAPKAKQNTLVEIMRNPGVDITVANPPITDQKQGTDWASFSVQAVTELVLRINIMDFPGWTVMSNGKEIPKYIPDTEEWGRIYIKLPKGDHNVTLQLKNTPVRTIGNYISIASWLVLIFLILKQKPFINGQK